MQRCTVCSRLGAPQWRRCSRAFPMRPRAKARRGRWTGERSALRSSRTQTHWRSLRRSCTPWCERASGAFSRRASAGAAASRCSTCRCSSRPAAKPAAMRQWWSRRRHFVQRARVLGRARMTEERLAAILARQMQDSEKRRRADFVIRTGLDRRVSRLAARRIAARLAAERGTRWPRCWSGALVQAGGNGHA